MKTAILANGCFWCTEAVFQRLKGVDNVMPGYTGGNIKNPAYREVCTGRTGHAEALKITFDPSIIDYKTLLEVYFATHDPTTLNRQGNDVGTQYRSEVFYTSETQKMEAEEMIESLTNKKTFDGPIVTKVSKLDVFYDAESDHKDYFINNPNQPYCQFAVVPKVEKIKKHFADKLK